MLNINKKEAIETGNYIVAARRHDIRPNAVERWVREFKNKGLIINKNKVYRLCKELNILSPPKDNKVKAS